MTKSFLCITIILLLSINLSGCASSNPGNNNFLPATYDVPIDLDVRNQQNSPNM